MAPKRILSYISKWNRKKSTEYREHPRHRAFNLIKFSLSNGASYESISNIVDISESGLKFTCYEELQPHQEISMAIHVPHANEEVTVEGRLVWVRKRRSVKGVYVAGVQFERLSAAHRELIREMVETRQYHR